ncbi:MAG: cysteine desulfurase [Spirochaetota bacterium]|nr:MAG: cysteine desulfurase [Spirochaetota bacterium]
MKKNTVYLDNNAATRVDPRVVKYMDEFHLHDYAVASSQFSHTPGIRAKESVDTSREIIAKRIGAKPGEIVFTSGETESNNLALMGAVASNKDKNRNKIIISKIEHFSVLHTAERLKRNGYELCYIDVDEEGFIDLEKLESLVDERTLFVSVMHANHEVGTIQDLNAVSKLAKKKNAYFHTDATYSFLQVPIDVEETGIDLLSIDANLIHGPKGVGALYVREGVSIEKIFEGGYQENNLRPGTENVPGIAGFGKACELFDKSDIHKVTELRNNLHTGLTSGIKGTLLNGPGDFSRRIPNNLNLSFEYIEGESVVLHLDMRGIAVITGSACFSRALQASHILLAMGFTHERAHGSIRFSPSKYTSNEDIDYTISNVKEVVEKLRELSPIGK